MSQTSSVLTFSALRSRSGDLERFFRSAAFFGGHGDGFSAAAAAEKPSPCPPKKAALRKKRSKSPLRDRNAENVKTDDVCDIDKRLNSLKAFLREAKSKPL